MKRTLVVLAIVWGSLLGAPALADHVLVEDGNDATGVLDVKRVKHIKGPPPQWRISTYRWWSLRTLLDQGYFMVNLDTFGSKRSDYYVLVWADKKRLHATLFRDRKDAADYAIKAVSVSKPNARTVLVTAPLRGLRIGDTRKHYTWYVQTLWSSSKCKRVCFDWAPNRGRNGNGIEEPLPKSLQE